jgi:hypothetical protein
VDLNCHSDHFVATLQSDDKTRGRTIIDDDTSAVVIVVGLLLIAAVGGYLTYQYVTNTSREPAVFKFKSNTMAELARTPHLTTLTIQGTNVRLTPSCPKTYILDMGFDKR